MSAHPLRDGVGTVFCLEAILMNVARNKTSYIVAHNGGTMGNLDGSLNYMGGCSHVPKKIYQRS